MGVVAGLFAVLIYFVARGGRGSEPDDKVARARAAGDIDPVKFELYVMSQCPYGVVAVNGAKEVMDRLGADVDFQLDYIGNSAPDGELTSMHGANEVTGDIAQLCAKKVAPSKYLAL